MKAVRIHDYGNADVLRFEEAPQPEIGPDDVLIRIHGAGVNPVDWKIRNGIMRQARPLRFPAILGADAAGTVEQVGPVVSRFRTYGIATPPVVSAYMDRMFALPAMQDWAKASQAEVDAGLA